MGGSGDFFAVNRGKGGNKTVEIKLKYLFSALSFHSVCLTN